MSEREAPRRTRLVAQRDLAAPERERASPQRTGALHELRRTRGNAAVGRELARRGTAAPGPRLDRAVYAFRVGGDLPLVLARAAREAAARGALAGPQVRRLQRVARDQGAGGGASQLFLAGLLDEDNARRLSRMQLTAGTTLEFSLASIRAGSSRLQALDRRHSRPAPVARRLVARATKDPPKPSSTPFTMQPQWEPAAGPIDAQVFKEAHNERLKIGMEDEHFQRNVAVFVYQIGDDPKPRFVAAANDPESGVHSEWECYRILDKADPGLAKTKILAVFSEREPCSGQCSPLLQRLRARGLDFPIYFWIPGHPGTLGERAKLLRNLYGRFFGPLPGSPTEPLEPAQPPEPAPKRSRGKRGKGGKGGEGAGEGGKGAAQEEPFSEIAPIVAKPPIKRPKATPKAPEPKQPVRPKPPAPKPVEASTVPPEPAKLPPEQAKLPPEPARLPPERPKASPEPPAKIASEPTASHESIEPFSRPPEPTKPAPVGGPLVEAGAVLLQEIEQALEREAVVRNARRRGSLLTYRWWLQRGLDPPARAVYDRWGLFSTDESDVGEDAIRHRIRSGYFDGMIVGRISRDDQYARFEAWARANVKTWDDLHRHFIASEDSGVRYRDGRWEVVSWEWSDWPPANVYRVVDEDERITALMEEIRGQVLAREEARVTASASGQDTFEPGSSARIAGLRVFRRWGDKSFFTMSNQIRLLMNWGYKPRFYAVEGVPGIPQGYTLVIGADVSTSITIHEKRATYDGTATTSGIHAPARYDKDAAYTGWGPVRVPCTLVQSDALEAP